MKCLIFTELLLFLWEVTSIIILSFLSLQHVFFCVRLYAFESSRLPRELNINSRVRTPISLFKFSFWLNNFSSKSFFVRDLTRILLSAPKKKKPLIHWYRNLGAQLCKFILGKYRDMKRTEFGYAKYYSLLPKKPGISDKFIKFILRGKKLYIYIKTLKHKFPHHS